MGVGSYQTVTVQSCPLPGKWSCVPFSLLQSCPSPLLPAWGWPKFSLLNFWESLWCNYAEDLVCPGRMGGLALSSVLGFPFCDTLEREMSPTSPTTTLLALLPPILPSCMFSDLLCFVPLGPPPFIWFPPSSPHPGKGSSLELQGVECNVYTLFCLCPHPTQCSEEPEKNLLSNVDMYPNSSSNSKYPWGLCLFLLCCGQCRLGQWASSSPCPCLPLYPRVPAKALSPSSSLLLASGQPLAPTAVTLAAFLTGPHLIPTPGI